MSSCRITETLWDSSHDCTAVAGYRLFRKYRLGTEEIEVMLYAEE